MVFGTAGELDAQEARHERRHRVLLLAAVREFVGVENDRARVADPEAVLRELLRLFLFFINHDLFTTTPGRVNSMDKEMITYIRQNYMNPISLADLSNQFHLSEKYLSRYFKEHFQLPFTQYLRHLRLTNAKTLLVSTDLPITQIALQCGFFNV